MLAFVDRALRKDNDQINAAKAEKLINYGLMKSVLKASEEKPKKSGFLITHVSLGQVKSKGGEKVIVSIDYNFSGLCFCKFGERTVYGKQLNETTLECKAPALHPGMTKLSVSMDKSKWCLPVDIEVIDNSDTDRYKLGIVMIVVLMFFGLCGLFFWNKGFRKRKLQKMQKKHTPLIESVKSSAGLTRRKGGFVL